MNYKIVSDSASNVFSLSQTDYACVPLKIITASKEYVDTPELDVPLMIEELRHSKGPSGTSCPNVHEWSEAFQGADAAFAVTITSALSGSYSAALQAALDHGNVHVIDSLTAGPEMQLLIEKLQDFILAGDSFDQICQKIHAYQQSTHTLFCLESLNNLARNGRINPAVAKIAGVLGIRVIGQGSSQGTLEPLHKSRGEKKALETIYSEMRKNNFHGGKVRISHCLNLPAAQQLENLIRQDFPDADVELLPSTALCSFYSEKGGLIIGYEG